MLCPALRATQEDLRSDTRLLLELSAPLSVVSVGSTRLRYVSFWRNNFTFSYEDGGRYVHRPLRSFGR